MAHLSDVRPIRLRGFGDTTPAAGGVGTLAAAAAGGGAGFLVGGPVGAAIGAGAGYFLGKGLVGGAAAAPAGVGAPAGAGTGLPQIVQAFAPVVQQPQPQQPAVDPYAAVLPKLQQAMSLTGGNAPFSAFTPAEMAAIKAHVINAAAAIGAGQNFTVLVPWVPLPQAFYGTIRLDQHGNWRDGPNLSSAWDSAVNGKGAQVFQNGNIQRVNVTSPWSSIISGVATIGGGAAGSLLGPAGTAAGAAAGSAATSALGYGGLGSEEEYGPDDFGDAAADAAAAAAAAAPAPAPSKITPTAVAVVGTLAVGAWLFLKPKHRHRRVA